MLDPQKAFEREAMLRRIRQLDAVHSGQRPELTVEVRLEKRR